ncbi:MAG: DNA-processing protein DprA [Deltaproteobacteria bacterium]|nr:DNA-processing protein DprA [Deltaproteobacteria bacterium]
MDSLRSWFYLKSVPGVGNLLCKRLIDRFKAPANVFQASDQELLQVNGLTQRHVAAIKSHKLEGVEAELALAAKKNYRLVTLTDSHYPRLLREIPDPPPFLYVYGRLERHSANLAVVGSRNPTGYGLSTTKDLCRSLAAHNLTIVSGMARGIDTAAHEGALAAGGKTIAVLGSGLEKIYPAENRKLFHRIAEKGAVVSEFPLMARPEAHHFPIRNRIISGMSLGTVVVEASRKSGSLITARLAAEQNREVFAVPGSIQSFKSAGSHTLIKQGAKLVEHAQDVIEELVPLVPVNQGLENKSGNHTREKIASLSDDEARVYQALDPYPVHVDDLARKISLEPGKLLSMLLKLELNGMVQQSPGKLFSISGKALADGR